MRIRPALFVILVSCALAGCGVPTPQTSTTETTPEPASTAAATSSAPPTPVAEAWVMYTTPDGSARFELPATWTAQVQPLPTEDPLAIAPVYLYDAAGIERLQYHPYLDGLGGACPQNYPLDYLEVTDVPVATDDGGQTQFMYRALETPDGVYATIGLSDAGTSITAACLVYNVFTSYPGASFGDGIGLGNDWRFDSVKDAKAYMTTPEYATLKRILSSLVIPG